MLNITGGGMSGGYRKYLSHIVPRMARNPDVSGLLIAMPDGIRFEAIERDLPNIRWLSLRPNLFAPSGIDRRAGECIRQFAPDVLFIPNGRYWGIHRVPTVNMIQNMEPLVYSDAQNPLSERIRNCLRRKATRGSLRRSQRVVAISDYVKQFLTKDIGLNPARVGLVYHGISGDTRTDGLAKPVTVPEDWRGTFVFTAGSIRPARGLEDVIQSLNERPLSSLETRLVIAGSAAPNMGPYARRLKAYISEHGISHRVIWAGNLAECEMAWCYRHSACFVMTSRVEACPNIALEAMHHGCLCVAADTPPLPEVFGAGAMFYRPRDKRDLSRYIGNVLRLTEAEAHEKRRMASERAAYFNWDVCAAKTVCELHTAIAFMGRRLPGSSCTDRGYSRAPSEMTCSPLEHAP